MFLTCLVKAINSCKHAKIFIKGTEVLQIPCYRCGTQLLLIALYDKNATYKPFFSQYPDGLFVFACFSSLLLPSQSARGSVTCRPLHLSSVWVGVAESKRLTGS